MEYSRLYRQFQPKHYTLRLEMEREKRRFSGTVIIDGLSAKGATSIQLHAHRLHVTKAVIDSQDATFEHGDQDTLTLSVPAFASGEHTVTLEFEGKITNPMHGLYPCYFKLDGKNEELLATQFESHHAREVFPCIDEPEAKATFSLTLLSETGISLVSNTPVKNQYEQNDRLVTTFETTPVMSTYLLAWTAGKLDYQEAVWPIPLLAGGRLGAELFDKISDSFEVNSASEPFMLNQGRTGYYLSVYDDTHIQRLAQQVRGGKMSVIDRIGLLSDGLNLSEAGLQPLMAALHLLDSYRQEESLPVWGVMSSYIGTLKIFADDDEGLLAALRIYTGNLARGQYQRLGWRPVVGESYFDELLRPTIIAHMAYAEDDEAVGKLRNMFNKANSPTDIWGDIRSIVFAVAARFGDADEFDRLLGWYRTTASAEQRVQLTAGLSSTRNPQLVRQALDLLTTDDVKLQDLFYWISGLITNRFARNQTWQWIINHFGNDMRYSDFPKYAASAFSQPEQLASYKTFFSPMIDQPGIGRTIAQGVEDIEGRIQWLERDGQAVDGYLRAFAQK